MRTLYARLALVLVGLFISMGLLYTVLTASATRHYTQEVSQQFNRDLARRLVADRNLVAEGRINEAALKETFHQYMVINPSIEIYLLDLEGTILSYSADPEKVKRRRVSLDPIEAFLRGDDYPLLGDDPRSHDRRKAFSVTPVPSAEAPEGYLYVVLRGEEFDSVEQMIRDSYFLRLSAWAAAGSLGFGLLAGLVILRLLTRRLQRLSAVMDGFDQSGFSTYRPYADDKPRGADEIDRLGQTFDRMARRIISQFNQLRDNDALRRELVAHVSHDLRTPLASLQGYLESLQIKDQDLSVEERADYLAIALRQCNRLTGLVEELFELAKLDARETNPRRESFSGAELAQDVIQKFKLAAEQRQVRLELVPPTGPCFVLADIALTERVLDNLIGNALDHTPAGGRVSVSLHEQDDRVEVGVADTGPGIAAADLPRVFEPFFRSTDRPEKGGHAGLGLAIAKRIAELHGGELRVQSRVNEGTVFTYWMPRGLIQDAR